MVSEQEKQALPYMATARNLSIKNEWDNIVSSVWKAIELGTRCCNFRINNECNQKRLDESGYIYRDNEGRIYW